MKSIQVLALAFVALVSAAPLEKRAGQTSVVIGQNYLDEWQSFQSGVKTPAGISTYGDIWSGALNSDSQNLLSAYAASESYVYLSSYELCCTCQASVNQRKHRGFVEVGMSWKDAMTSNGYTQYQVRKPMVFNFGKLTLLLGSTALSQYCKRHVRWPVELSRLLPCHVSKRQVHLPC